MSNREMIESALKRVERLTGVRGKIYNDNTGWFIIGEGHKMYDESAKTAVELIAYLHGIEDALRFVKL